ncbi:Protein CBG10280 [Caenorhabditis briggsae]|uniref:Protein CBG10280 n=1 Tax=Caenorhabditis briggsae TaxID=6238 RepID=A8XAP8_CAEBR|nr:Protein CBG10280 [Caenorhabditis briggsae]CAP29713.1 Protein CBG10280 [Caenorhabditis briggsae]
MGHSNLARGRVSSTALGTNTAENNDRRGPTRNSGAAGRSVPGRGRPRGRARGSVPIRETLTICNQKIQEHSRKNKRFYMWASIRESTKLEGISNSKNPKLQEVGKFQEVGNTRSLEAQKTF